VSVTRGSSTQALSGWSGWERKMSARIENGPATVHA
jgi:hypothetical protein